MTDKSNDSDSSEKAVANDHLLAVDAQDGYAIRPPWGWDDDYKAHESLARTPDDAWKRFCHPALNRAAYEADGFEAVPVKMEIRFGIAAWMKTLTDEQVIEKTLTAVKDMGEAAENERDSEWHQSCFAAVALYAEEVERRGIRLPANSVI